MDNKVDIRKIESYSLALTEKLSNDFFQRNSAISGSEIMKFNSIEQINVFIIKNLFDKWKEETSKLKSPYFDYENKEVSELLKAFQNKLSQHISVGREFFKPLLHKAISDTLSLILVPYEYIKNDYLNNDPIDWLKIKERAKYIKINNFLITGFIQKYESSSTRDLSAKAAHNILYQVYTQQASALEDQKKYVDLFSYQLKLEYNELLGISVETRPKAEPVMKTENVSDNMLNQKFSNEQPTINDLLKKDSQTTLADKLGKTKIEDLKTGISLNKKFLFINELFNGMNSDYNLALMDIDRCNNYESAINLLKENYARKFNWDPNKNEVKEFFETVERKFLA